jgi:CheY-like chemotaxis protein
VFRAGKVVAAFRTNSRASVGEGLLAASVVSPTTYQEMLASQRGGKRALDLFSAFGLDKEAVREALDGLLKQVIYDMFEWNEGTFSFVLEDAPDVWRGFSLEGTRAVSESGLNPQFLAIEGARIRDERMKEDSLSSFLAKEKQPPAAARPGGQMSVQEIAAKLRGAAELDAGPSAGPTAATVEVLAPAALAPATVREKVIPFPADHVKPHPAETDDTSFAGLVDAPPPARPPAPPPVAPPAAAPVAPAAPPVAVEPAPVTPVAGPLLEPVPAPVPEPAPAAPPPSAVRPVARAAGAGRRRLLAIDDDPQVTRHIEGALAPLFSRVTAVDTVRDALADLEADPTDVVVAADLIIARSDGRGILGGIEILERVRERWPELPVVLFTDYQNEEAEARAKSLGALAVLSKPRKAQVQAKDAGGVVQSFLDALVKLLEPHAAPEATTAFEPPRATAAVSPGEGFDLASEMSDEMDELGRTFDDDAPPAHLSAGDMAVLRSMLAELIDPANRDTVTLLVLRFASNLCERACLFLATRRAFVGLGGFSADEGSDQFVARVRRIQVPVEHESVFTRVAQYRSLIRAPLKDLEGNRRLAKGLGGEWPAGETLAAPLISGDRVAAILFADNPSGKPLGPTDGLEIFLQQAGLAMDRALLERRLEDSRKKDDPE